MNITLGFQFSLSMVLVLFFTGTLFGAAASPGAQSQTLNSPAAPIFTAGTAGEFEFNTGLLRGKLRAGGKSLGLSSVIHVPSGKRLDRSNGLFSHYRVFTHQKRYGGGAWDWPSEARLREDGAVEVRWAVAEGRPFSMRAIYRWRNANTLDLETLVQAEKDLPRFESFLASYFSESFTNAAVSVGKSSEADGQPAFLPARTAYGPWQMFPREPSMLNLIMDGRWQLQPNPVDWKIMPSLAQPLGFRRDPETGLTVLVMSPATDCFAMALPHQTEGHFSFYLSLFGREIKAGEIARARARLLVAERPSEQEMIKFYQAYSQELGK